MNINKYLITEKKKISDYNYNYMPENPLEDGKLIINKALQDIKKKFLISNDRVSVDEDGRSYVVFSWKEDRTVMKMMKPKEKYAEIKWKESGYSKKGSHEWLLVVTVGWGDFGGWEVESKKNLYSLLKDQGVPEK